LILDDIMEKGGDGLVFVSAMREDDGGHTQEMSDIGATGALTELRGVRGRSIEQCTVETLTKRAFTKAPLTKRSRFLARCSHKLWKLLATAKL